MEKVLDVVVIGAGLSGAKEQLACDVIYVVKLSGRASVHDSNIVEVAQDTS